MGIDYEALDLTLNRAVALKVLMPELAANPAFELRFLEEARAAARLSHPGLVGVFEAGRHRGQLYFAMELVPGQPLSQIARSRKFTLDEAVNIAAQAAEALAAAHQAGLIHRDVKPSNILITPEMKVKILDFGLVRATRPAREPLTAAGSMVGTPGYASPESLMGHAVEPRSDVYSLGVVLHEMLTNDAAFEARSIYDLISKISSGQLKRSLSDVPEVPSNLRGLVERMMSINVARRPFAHQVVKELGQFAPRTSEPRS
jgi:serine/threonine-protein kinase